LVSEKARAKLVEDLEHLDQQIQQNNLATKYMLAEAEQQAKQKQIALEQYKNRTPVGFKQENVVR